MTYVQRPAGIDLPVELEQRVNHIIRASKDAAVDETKFAAHADAVRRHTEVLPFAQQIEVRARLAQAAAAQATPGYRFQCFGFEDEAMTRPDLRLVAIDGFRPPSSSDASTPAPGFHP